MKIGILKDSTTNAHQNYINACKDLGVDYELIDIMIADWIDKIKSSDCAGFLVKPAVFKQYHKDMYDERVYFIETILKRPVYPSFNEIFIYENKNNMYYWLESHNIPHPKTYLFYDKNEALEFINTANYPLVFKTKIGSAGLGVKFVKNKRQAKKLIRKAFPYKPHIVLGWIHPGITKVVVSKRCKLARTKMVDDKQYGFVMFQEKLPQIKCEWRMIKIGESYFGHQKLEAKNGKHSGSGLVGWVGPPKELLDLVKHICDLGNFNSMNVDIFETVDGKYYVNELQTIFGSIDNSQMYIDGVPGRYKFINGEWVFEEGYFSQNASMNLRVENFVNILKNK